MGHPSYQGGPFSSAPLSQPCPLPPFRSAMFPSTGPGLAHPTAKALGEVLPLWMVRVPSAW